MNRNVIGSSAVNYYPIPEYANCFVLLEHEMVPRYVMGSRKILYVCGMKMKYWLLKSGIKIPLIEGTLEEMKFEAIQILRTGVSYKQLALRMK